MRQLTKGKSRGPKGYQRSRRKVEANLNLVHPPPGKTIINPNSPKPSFVKAFLGWLINV